MAEQRERSDEASSQTTPNRRGPMKVIGVGAMILVLDAGLIWGGVRYFRTSKIGLANGNSTAIQPPSEQDDKTAELLIAKMTAPNTKQGRTWMYDMEVHAVVPVEMVDPLKACLASHEAQVKDSLRSIIANAELGDLTHPELRQIRDRIKVCMNQIAGKDVFEKILISDWIPVPAR